MTKTFWKFWKARLTKTDSLFSGVLAFVVSILLGNELKDIKIGLGWFASLVIVSLFLLLVYHNAARDIHEAYRAESERANRHQLPRVIQSRGPQPSVPGAHVVCLLEPSDLFSYGTYVSFFMVMDEFEEELGVGRVVMVQTNKLIQVELLHYHQAHQATVARLANDDTKVREQLRIKPTVSWERVQGAI